MNTIDNSQGLIEGNQTQLSTSEDVGAESKAKPASKAKPKKTPAKMKVKFIASPSGRFGLNYRVGEEVTLEGKQALECISANVAEKV